MAESTVDGGTATVGLNAQARDRDGDEIVDDVKGEFQFNDHSLGLAFHGKVPDGGVVAIQRFKLDDEGNPVLSENTFIATGTYMPIPRTDGPGGVFEVIWADFGDEGPDEGDAFTLSLIGGVYDGYFNDLIIQGGNFSRLDR